MVMLMKRGVERHMSWNTDQPAARRERLWLHTLGITVRLGRVARLARPSLITIFRGKEMQRPDPAARRDRWAF
jgi:hypothetical protein